MSDKFKLTASLLKEIRLNDLNMSLGELSEHVGYSRSRLDSMERHGRPIPKDMVKLLKKLLEKKLVLLNKSVDKLYTN